jgi:protein gp37
MIFTCSWSDFFIEQADGWRADAWKVIKATPWHVWQILTKRPERIAECLPPDWGPDGYPNVWLGVSAGDSTELKRVKHLLRVPARIRFLSAEPLIEDISHTIYYETPKSFVTIDWLIIGGESGNNSGKHQFRETKLEWIKNLIDVYFQDNGIPVFVKQLGRHLSRELKLKNPIGADPLEWPGEINYQNFPFNNHG